MKGRSKILAGSSVLALLALGGSGLALGLAYSGELFSLLPVLSSIGLSTMSPILIATTALFVSLSLVLSISFVRSRHLEKKEKEAKKEKEENQENQSKGRRKVINFSNEEKEDYFKKAIQNFDEKAIKLIVSEKDLFKDVMSKYGDLVYYAAKVGGDNLVKHIVKKLKININEPFSSQYSAIYYAIESKDAKTLQCLIDNKADPTKIRLKVGSKTQNSEKTPLMEASGKLQKENVGLLLNIKEVKDNINTVNSLGNTALIGIFKERTKQAEKDMQYKVAKLLLDQGADPTIENNKKQTALSIADRHKCELRVILMLADAEKEWIAKHKKSHVDRVQNSNPSKTHEK